MEGTGTDSLKGIRSGRAVRDRPLVADSGQLASHLLGVRTLGSSSSLGVRFSLGKDVGLFYEISSLPAN